MNWRLLTILTVCTSLSACFRSNSSTGSMYKGAREKIASAGTSVSDTKSLSNFDPSSTVAQQLAPPAVEQLKGSSVVVPPGSLGISASLVFEQAANFDDTSIANEVALADDIEISGTSAGIVIRPTENTDLKKPLTISMPLPTLALHLAEVESSRYAVFYKYFDPNNGLLMTGLKVVDGSNVRIVFDEGAGRDTIVLEGYFGAYWAAVMSREVKQEELPQPAQATEPVINIAKVSVIEKTGVVAETEVTIKQQIPEVAWQKPTLSLNAEKRSVSAAASIADGRSIKNCKVDVFEKTDVNKGLTLDSAKGLSAEVLIEKAEAHTVYGRFRCQDDQDRVSLSPWSEPLAIPLLPPLSITAVSSDSANAFYKSGDSIAIALRFSDKVFVENEGDIRLHLKTGSVDRLAAYQSGSGSTTLVFSYQFQDGDATDALDYAGAEALVLGTAGKIRGTAQNNASLKLPIFDGVGALAKSKAIVVDTLAPLAPPSVGFGAAASNSGSLIVNWAPAVEAHMKHYNVKLCAAADCQSSCSAVSQGTASPLTLNAASGSAYYACVQAEDQTGHLSAWTASLSSALVDTSVPLVTSVTSPTADAAYKIGQRLSISVHFNQNVFVSAGAAPTLLLETGTDDHAANYESGSGSSTLVFGFIVQSGDTAGDLNYKSTGALTLASGSLSNSIGTPAVLSLPALSSAQSLAGSKALILDTRAPTAGSGIVFPAGASIASTTVPMTWQKGSDTNFKQSHVKICTSSTCDTGCTAPQSTTGTSADLLGVAGNSYYGCVQSEDMAGNKSSFAHSAQAIAINTNTPSVVKVTTSNSSGSVKAGSIAISVEFSENVTVTNPSSVKLQLETGATDRFATYVSGSGGNKLQFSYAIQAGDSTELLNYLSPTSLILSGGASIKNTAGTSAVLLLPPLNSSLALAGSAQIRVDTLAPAAPSAIAFGTPSAGQVPITWNSTASDILNFTLQFCADNACSSSCSNLPNSSTTQTNVALPASASYACIRAQDLAGNISNLGVSATAFVPDLSAPTVLSVTSSEADGYYSTDDGLVIEVQFSEPVIVGDGNAIGFRLETGTIDRTATYTSGSGTNTLHFTYAVIAGDTSPDLEALSNNPFILGTGTIKDAGGNAALLTIPTLGAGQSLSGSKAFVIDTTPPQSPSSVTVSAPLLGNITVSWTPGVESNPLYHGVYSCTTSACNSGCSLLTQTSTSSWTFSQLLTPAFACVNTTDQAGLSSAFTPSGIALPILDVTAPSVSAVSFLNPSVYLREGEASAIDISFTEAVLVTDGANLKVQLETGATDAFAMYTSGSGSTTLRFVYTVAAGEQSGDLDFVSSTPFAGSGTIKDAAGNNATFTVPTPGTGPSLSASGAVVIDTSNPVAPTAVSFGTPSGSTIPLTWTFAADPTFNRFEVQLCDNSLCSTNCVSPMPAPSSPASLPLPGNAKYGCVRSVDNSGNLSGFAATSVTSPTDTTAPTITSMTSSQADGFFKVGQVIPIEVQFSENVQVNNFGDVHLLLDVGTARQVPYASGSGTSTLVFHYTVQAADSSADLECQSTSCVLLGATGGINDLAGNAAVLTSPSLGSSNSLSFAKNFRIDTAVPSMPSSIGFPSATATVPSLSVSWGASTDASTVSYKAQLCTNSDCVNSCTSPQTTAATSINLTAPYDGSFYACVSASDQALNETAFVSSASPVLVDTVYPTITQVDGVQAFGFAAKAGVPLQIQVHFSEPIVLSGTDINLQLETGASDGIATYLTQASNILTLTYTPTVGHTASPLNYNVTVLAGSASIQDAAGNAASLLLPALGGPNALAQTRAYVVDTAAPLAANNVALSAQEVTTPTAGATWNQTSPEASMLWDTKACVSNDCSTGCVSAAQRSVQNVSFTGLSDNSDYYACVQSRDPAGNVSAYIASPTAVRVRTTVQMAGVSSVEVLGAEPTEPKARLRFTLASEVHGPVSKYRVYFKPEGGSFGPFVAEVPRGGSLDSNPFDNSFDALLPVHLLRDGYYKVQAVDASAAEHSNAVESPLTMVLPDKPGYVLMHPLHTGLAYEYYIMRYEASVSGATSPGDTITMDPNALATCNNQFHQTFAAFYSSCGTKTHMAAAQSMLGVLPTSNINFAEAFTACRNASGGGAMVRLPTLEEWRRASRTEATNYTNYTAIVKGGSSPNCNVNSGTLAQTGGRTACKSAFGVYDMAGNVREWVDVRASITSLSYTRFSGLKNIGAINGNGIDNRSWHLQNASDASGNHALSMGADFVSGSPAKEYGEEAQNWDLATAQAQGSGFRCVAFRNSKMPTPEALALPNEPRFTTADTSVGLAGNRIPENMALSDPKWEQVSIEVINPGDSILAGNIKIKWSPWSKKVCNPTCVTDPNPMTYKIYRFAEPSKRAVTGANNWILADGIIFTSDKPMDPLLTDLNSGNPIYSNPVGNLGGPVRVVTDCNPGNEIACEFIDGLGASTGFGADMVYNYLLVAVDSEGNHMPAQVQRYRSVFQAGMPDPFFRSPTRIEYRFRRAGIFPVDRAYQLAQVKPQVMSYVPMDLSGLDRDFFIQTFEASMTMGSVANGSSSANWPLQASGAAWAPSAGQCYDIMSSTGLIDPICGSGSAANPTLAQLKSGLSDLPIRDIDQGAMIKACMNTTLLDGAGRSFRLHLATDAEWAKAADWGDTDFNGSIDQNPFSENIGMQVSSIVTGAGGAIQPCHTDNAPAAIIGAMDPTMENCVSRYGVMGMIGNVGEWTAEQSYNNIGLDNGIDGLNFGQSIAASGATNFDLLRGIHIPGTGVTLSASDGAMVPNASGLMGKERGGRYQHTSQAGRFREQFVAPSTGIQPIGGRCVY